jgi:hypothetical protein
VLWVASRRCPCTDHINFTCVTQEEKLRRSAERFVLVGVHMVLKSPCCFAFQEGIFVCQYCFAGNFAVRCRRTGKTAVRALVFNDQQALQRHILAQHASRLRRYWQCPAPTCGYRCSSRSSSIDHLQQCPALDDREETFLERSGFVFTTDGSRKLRGILKKAPTARVPVYESAGDLLYDCKQVTFSFAHTGSFVVCISLY